VIGLALEIGELGDFIQQCRQFILSDSRLALLASQIHFDKSPDRFAALFPLLIEFPRQGDIIQRFNHVEQIDRGFNYVALQMADHVPFNRRLDLLLFLLRLLNVVLTDQRNPRRYRRSNRHDTLRLCRRQQPDILSLPPGSLCRCSNFIE
jgi:hypothetical protein